MIVLGGGPGRNRKPGLAGNLAGVTADDVHGYG